ncbi:hypothetical protein C1645_549064 [Glomus cerebriforme]|uniref:Uncharacterized protein n=1 Tax=Glomus cerebriforme TaxID=658196 RepID=A0A397TCC8_9GLOM|nr:hypothetical protein C1645_549064 [Glomus cerebriforme]
MDKGIELPTIPTIQEVTLSPTSTFGEVDGVCDTDEGPENDSDYRENQFDDDFYKELSEIELETSDSGEESELHNGEIEDEIKGVESEESSSQATELQDVSYFSSSEDEAAIENFSKNLRHVNLDEELDLKALDDSATNIKGASKEDYLREVGELSLVDENLPKDSPKIKRTRHRKIYISNSQEQQKDKYLDNKRLIEQEEQTQGEFYQEQISQKKERQQKQSLKEQRMREGNSKEKKSEENEECLRHENERQLQLEREKKLKEEQLRLEQKLESRRLSREEQLQREEQLHIRKKHQLQINEPNFLQQRPFPSLHSQSKKFSSPQRQRSIYGEIFKPGIESQNEHITPTTPSLSAKSFHLPDISLSQQSDVREFKRMSNIFGNSDKGPAAALRTLTDNYRQLELDKRNADIKVDQLEKQLEQYRQLLQKEQSKSNVNYIETITYESDTKSSSQRKFILSEKEKTDSPVVQKKYKAMKRQLEYMKTYARKAEDERDEAKKALVKTQQDIAQMNDRIESLRASVQIPNNRTQISNIAVPIQQLSNINRSKDKINVHENRQIIEPKEIIRDSGSEKSKSHEKVDNKLGNFRRKLIAAVGLEKI